MTASERIRAAREAAALASGEAEGLMRQAEESCKRRGHTLGAWTPGDYWKDCRFADCTVCGAGVQVDPSPPPNGIDISGPAVALNCPVASGDAD